MSTSRLSNSNAAGTGVGNDDNTLPAAASEPTIGRAASGQVNERLKLGRQDSALSDRIWVSPAAEQGGCSRPIADTADSRYSRSMRLLVCLLLPLIIAACQANPYAAIPDAELHAKAKTLALAERYDFYLEVLHSRTPSRPIIAEDISVLGTPAWDYVFQRALSQGSAELSQALPVLWAFERRCSRQELHQLREHASSGASANQAAALKSSIDTLCGAELPSED